MNDDEVLVGTADEEVTAEDDAPELYSSQDVAKIFRVDVKTVARWAKPDGEFIRRNVQILTTIGGHRRFFKEEIHQLFQLMLEDKLYREDDGNKSGKAGSPFRIAGLPKPTKGDPRFE